MRSKSADSGRLITFGFHVAEAASGQGVATNGITWRMVRPGTGTYIYRLSKGIQVLSVSGAGDSQGYYFVEAYSIVEEYFVISTIGHNGVPGNIPHSIVVTALDNRP